MDRAKAIEAARALAGTMFPPDTETAALDALLARSVVPDMVGRWPADPNWTPSYDPDWLAAEAVNVHLIRSMSDGVVTRWTSEGTTFESTPADLMGMVSALRARSIIASWADGSLSYIDVHRTDDTGYRPRSGSWPYSDRDDVVGNWS